MPKLLRRHLAENLTALVINMFATDYTARDFLVFQVIMLHLGFLPLRQGLSLKMALEIPNARFRDPEKTKLGALERMIEILLQNSVETWINGIETGPVGLRSNFPS